MLRAVERHAAGFLELGWRHDTVAQHFAVTLFVVTEHDGGEIVTASVPLAEGGVDLYFHRDIPLCSRADPVIPMLGKNIRTCPRQPLQGAGRVIPAFRSLDVHYWHFLKSLMGGVVYRTRAREWLLAHETMLVRAVFLN